MLVGNSYTRFVIFLAKTIFEIRCCAAIMTRYEEFKTIINSVVQKNEFACFYRWCTNYYVFLSDHVHVY